MKISIIAYLPVIAGIIGGLIGGRIHKNYKRRKESERYSNNPDIPQNR